MRSTWTLAAALLFSVTCLAQGSNLELDVLLTESNQLLQQGQATDALALLERQQDRYSNRPEYLNNLAVALLGSSQPDRALTLLRSYVQSDPVFSILFHNLLELELQTNRAPADQLNPILFVQSVDSFLETGLQEIDNQATAGAEGTGSCSGGTALPGNWPKAGQCQPGRLPAPAT